MNYEGLHDIIHQRMGLIPGECKCDCCLAQNDKLFSSISFIRRGYDRMVVEFTTAYRYAINQYISPLLL